MAAGTAELLINIKATNAQAKRVAEDTKRSFSSIASSLRKAGGVMTAAVTAPLMLLGREAVNAASDMEESLSKVGVVFGDLSDEVVAWSETSAESFGLSQQAALEAAGTFGNLFTAMNLPADAAAEMSTELVQLAGDLASFNNITVDEALTKLRAGLVGEVEPLRTLGVQLSAATVEAKAMAMGLADAEGELSQSALAQARYALILEQTATAQGDYARTSDGLANSQRTLQAQLSDLAAELGTVLLPYITDLVNWISQAVQWFDGMSPSVQKVVVVIGVLAAAIGPVLMGIGMMIPAIEAAIAVFGVIAGILSGPVLLAIAAVVGIVALLYTAWTNNWGGIPEKTRAVIDFISEKVQAGLEFIQGVVNSALAAISVWWDAHGESVMTVVNGMWGLIKGAFEIAMEAIKLIVEQGIAAIVAFWELFGEPIMIAINGALEGIKILFSGLFEALGLLFDAFAAAFEGDWETFGEKLREALETALGAILSAFEKWGETLIKASVKVAENIWNAIKEIDWAELGRAIIDGIAAGIRAGATAIADAARSAAKAALDAAKGFLGIDSPSKVMKAEVGIQIARGWAEGIRAGVKEIDAAISGIGMATIAGVQQQPAPVVTAPAAGTTINLTVNNPIPVRSDEDILRKLTLLSALGVAV